MTNQSPWRPHTGCLNNTAKDKLIVITFQVLRIIVASCKKFEKSEFRVIELA